MLELIPHLLTALPASSLEVVTIEPLEKTELVVTQESPAPAPSPLAIPVEAAPLATPQAISLPEASAPEPSPAPQVVVPTLEELATPAVTAPSTVIVPAEQLLKPDASPTFKGNAAAFEAIKTERKQMLERKLADIVERDKPAKEEQLRQNLMAAAISYAEAGQFDLARQTAQHPVLSPETQADLLAEIDAIASAGSPQPVVAKEVTAQCQTVLSALTTEEQNLADLLCSTAKVAPKVETKTAGTLKVTPISTSTPHLSAPSSSWTQQSLPEPRINTVQLGPISLSKLGGYTTPAAESYYSRTQRPQGRPGNGNLRLMYPLAIPSSVTSVFGWRIHPITGDRRFHSGTDLGAPMGTPVLAAYAGRVAVSEFLGGYGLSVGLEHDKGKAETLYAHLSEIFVKAGEWVEQGTVIGRVGSTGNSTGPHLHFELRQLTPEGWVAVNPDMELERAYAEAWNTPAAIASLADNLSMPVANLQPLNLNTFGINPVGVGGDSPFSLQFDRTKGQPTFSWMLPSAITSAFGWFLNPPTGQQRLQMVSELSAPLGTPMLAAYAGKLAITDFLAGNIR